jgi:microcystin degradation protein MlrC
MRFVLANINHETNTFSPVPTPLSSFAIGRPGGKPVAGAEAVDAFRGTNTPLAAFIDLAGELNAEILLPVAGTAAPSGPVKDSAFDAMADALCDAVRTGCDAAFLDLHGAMVTESCDDGEGEILSRIRKIAPDLSIAVALDFHANISPTMVEKATVISGYQTYPHTDTYQTGARCGRVLLRSLKGEVMPRRVWGRLPMLTHTLCQSPARQPMKDIMVRALEAQKSGLVLDASVFAGFPMADIPYVGFAVLIIAGDHLPDAERLRDDLMGMAWERRADFVFQVEPVADSIAKAKRLKEGPIVLVDHGDNVFSGGTQDVMETVAEALRQGLTDMAVGPIWDAESVRQMIRSGVGNRVKLQLGGKTDMPSLGLKGKPLEVEGLVRRITDGLYKVTCPMDTGLILNHGPSAVLDTGDAEILVCSERMEPYDLGVFRHAGIEPTAKRYLLIKSREHFRAGFEPIARHIVLVSGPGVTGSDYGLFPFKKIPRPIYPFDRDMRL